MYLYNSKPTIAWIAMERWHETEFVAETSKSKRVTGEEKSGKEN